MVSVMISVSQNIGYIEKSNAMLQMISSNKRISTESTGNLFYDCANFANGRCASL